MPDNTIRNQLTHLLVDSIGYGEHDLEDGTDAILAAGWRPPARVIETAEALDALKSGAIVLDSEGDVFRHRGDWWEFFGGYEEQSRTAHIALPATVLWQPEVSANA